MKYTRVLCLIFIVAISSIVQGSTITITSNAGSTEWWLAYAINDPATTNVELKDSGNYNTWRALTATNWGFWTFATVGSPVLFPVSLRLTSGGSQITILNAFETSAPGASLDTTAAYTPGSITVTPVRAPVQNPAQPIPKQPNAPLAPQPPASPSSPNFASNPFAGTEYYINPHYTLEVDSSIASNPSQSSILAKVKAFASAFWIDRMSVIDNVTTILTQARAQSQSSGKQVMAALVVYDLPSRDCAALASNGEINCADSSCIEGINTYKTQYIDPIIAVLREFPDLTIVAFVEPDSIPNLATNLGTPKCSLAQNAYKTCVAYAIQELATLSNVAIYVDAAHGGWLGWDDGRNKAASLYAQILTLAGGSNKIRGFATNVANYQPLGSMTDTADPCRLASQYNFAINEVKYVNLLDSSLSALGITGMHYVIDTGRNGVINARSDCSNWCNIKGAGLGVPPTSNTASSGLSNIDAFFWVKPPGESDGTSDSTAARYDAHCGSVDSAKSAPEAGNWYSSYFVALAENANPSL